MLAETNIMQSFTKVQVFQSEKVKQECLFVFVTLNRTEKRRLGNLLMSLYAVSIKDVSDSFIFLRFHTIVVDCIPRWCQKGGLFVLFKTWQTILSQTHLQHQVDLEHFRSARRHL